MKILFFSPHAGFWKHHVQDILVANVLKKNHEIFFFGCSGDIDFSCMYINSRSKTKFNTDNEKLKKKICSECIARKKINNNFTILEFSKYLDADSDIKIEKILKNVNRQNYKSLMQNEIEVGRIALHDLILLNKLNQIKNLDDEMWKNYLLFLKSTLKTCNALNNLFNNKNFDIVITSNNLYNVNQCATKLAKKRNIRCLSIAPGKNFYDRINKISFFEPNLINETEFLVKDWNKISNLNFELNFDIIKKYLKTIFDAEHKMIYSPKINKTKKINFTLNKNNKKILVILSGADENLAGIESGNDITSDSNYKAIFKNQIDWIEELIKFAKKNQDKDFIFRPHPRDWPIKGQKFLLSENYLFFQKFKNQIKNEKNIFLDNPEDNYSIYNYLEFVDLCLTYGTTTGLEFGIFGIPVLDGDIYKLGYPPQNGMVYNNQKEYFSLLEKKTTYEKNILYSINYFRWLHLVFEIDTVEISNRFMKKSDLYTLKNIILKGFFKITNLLSLNFEEKFDLKNLYINEDKKKIINYLIDNNLDNFFETKLKMNLIKQDNNNKFYHEKKEIKNIFNELSKKYLNKKNSYEKFVNSIN